MKLSQEGMPSTTVVGDTSYEEREHIKSSLESGRLEAICVVRCFNEGTSINALRTVMFADRRHSRIAIQQLAMRITRRHPSKSIGNIVWPTMLEETDADLEDLMFFLTAITAVNSSIKDRIHYKQAEWIRVTTVRQSHGMDWNVEDNGNTGNSWLYEMLFDRTGHFLQARGEYDRGQKHRLEDLLNWVLTHGRLPKQYSHQSAEEESLAKWIASLGCQYRRKTLSQSLITGLEKIPFMDDRVAEWRILQPDVSFEERITYLRSYIHEHRSLPAAGVDNSEARNLFQWLRNQKKRILNEKIDKLELKELESVPLLAELIHQWKNDCENRINTWGDRFHDLKRWMEQHDGCPPRCNVEDEHKLGTWLQTLRRQYQRGLLSAENLQALREIPGMIGVIGRWRPDAYKRWANDWKELAQRVQAWVSENGGLPSCISEHPEEVHLGRWLRKMKHKAIRNLLTEEQAELLGKLPGLAFMADGGPPSLAKHSSLDQRIHDLRIFVSNNGRLPKSTAPCKEEREGKLAMWMQYARKRFIKGTLGDDQLRQLSEIPGMKARIGKWRRSMREPQSQ
eukprot:TRINITY_DN88807_c0_g1_i1.p1 TRINITY_DN88807_c0_g1~~TRINITY_DN88807_c0_g1_i1.p1  ORF type:complete len:566 (-),score=92.31 TRINITY_DN88807_c0_g1_i1:321-2018(-)